MLNPVREGEEEIEVISYCRLLKILENFLFNVLIEASFKPFSFELDTTNKFCMHFLL